MRHSTAAARKVPSGNAQGLYRSSCERYPVDPLSLPRFTGEVFGSFIPGTASQKWAQLALRCLDAEIIQEGEGLPSDSSELVRHGLSQWTSAICGPLQNICSISMFAGIEAVAMVHSEKFEEESPDRWYWGFDGDAGLVYTLKEKVTRLELAHPGLGETALHWLTRASFSTWTALTPSVCRDIAERCWWYGAHDDENFRETYEEMEGEAPGADIEHTPSWFDAQFPDHILRPSTALDRAALTALIGQEGEAATVAQTVVNVMDLLEQGCTFPDMSKTDNETVYFSAVLQWDENDPVMQVLDDWINEANQCGDCYSTCVGVDAAELDADGFTNWKRLAENGLRLLGLVDSLVGQLGTLQN